MLGVKLVGALLLFGTGLVATLISRQRERRKLQVLEGWIALIRYIENQIGCYLTPLGEILSSIEPLREDRPVVASATERLLAVLRECQSDLDAEDQRLLKEFIAQLGNGYREDQINLCRHTLQTLSDLRNQKAAELPARLRVNTALCLGAAAGGILLLW